MSRQSDKYEHIPRKIRVYHTKKAKPYIQAMPVSFIKDERKEAEKLTRPKLDKRHREHRAFDWPNLLGSEAHLATHIASFDVFSDIQLPAVRRHLRFAVATEQIVELPTGRYKYYCSTETWKSFIKSRLQK